MARPTAKDTSNMAFSRSLFFLIFATAARICVTFGDVQVQQTLDLNQNQSVPLVNNNFTSEPVPVFSIKNVTTTRLFADRYARFLSITQGHYAPMKNVEDNEIEDKNDPQEDDPMVPLYGIYKDCLFRLSFHCVQRKLLVALDRFSRMKSFSILGDLLSIVRTKRELGPVIKESELEARLNPDEASSTLSALMEHNVERFLQQHVLRVTLPAGMTASVSSNARSFAAGSSIGNTIDINLTRALEEMGRGKGDKKMKKLMGMMMTGLMGKMAFMGPMMVLLIKLKALKALILSKIALMLSLFQLFKGKKGGGGGGHGKEVIIVHDAHSGGGGQDSYGSTGWATGGGGWSNGGGGGGGWLASQGDSYSSGPNTGGGDATYAGTEYSAGGHPAPAGNTWGAAGGGGAAAGGWGRRSALGNDPHWFAYKAYTSGEE